MALKKYEDEYVTLVKVKKPTTVAQPEIAEPKVDAVPSWFEKLQQGETTTVGQLQGSDVGSGTATAPSADGEKSEWEKYKEQYLADQTAMYQDYGKRAMQDTVGEISARTGGLASSYAGIVGQETYDNYMQELAAKYPDLVAAAMEMYNLEHPAAQTIKGVSFAGSGSYGSEEDSKKKEKTKAKTNGVKDDGAEDKDIASGLRGEGYTEEELWALQGRNPDYVEKNTTASERETAYGDALFRAINPMYSQVIDPYYNSTAEDIADKVLNGGGYAPDLTGLMTPEGLAMYLMERERLKKYGK